jgi:hypothetical protein
MDGAMFKKKEIILNAYTTIPAVFELYKPKVGTRNTPDWFKKLPPYEKTSEDIVKKIFNARISPSAPPVSTMKYCAGLIDLLKSEITLPLWSDYAINYNKESFDWVTAADYASGEMHNIQEQAKGWLTFENTTHFKLTNPWHFKCDEDVNFLMTNADYFINEENLFKYKVINGVINFKKVHDAHVNLIFPVQEYDDSQVFLEADSAIASLIPLSDRPIKINYHLIDDLELTKLRAKNKNTCFFRKYLKQHKDKG